MTIEEAQRKAFVKLALSAASAKRARDAYRTIMLDTFSYPRGYRILIEQTLATASAANSLLLESLLMPIVRVYPCAVCAGTGVTNVINGEIGHTIACVVCDGDGYDAARLED